MSDTILPLQKLLVLYFLDQANFAISSAQLTDFMLEKEYIPYMPLRHVISDLEDSNMIESKVYHNKTLLSITAEGHKALHYFEYRIHGDIREDIRHYLVEQEYALRNDISILSEYSRLSSGSFRVNLTAKEQDELLLAITMTIPTKTEAETICEHWQERSQEIYQYLTEKLF
jgi:hypothetical protein